MSKNIIIKGALILTLANIITRILGFINRLKEKIDRNGVITQYSYNMYSNLLYRKTKDNRLQEIYTYSKDGYLELVEETLFLMNMTKMEIK